MGEGKVDNAGAQGMAAKEGILELMMRIKKGHFILALYNKKEG